jgi:hypothetical protein
MKIPLDRPLGELGLHTTATRLDAALAESRRLRGLLVANTLRAREILDRFDEGLTGFDPGLAPSDPD